MKIDERTLKILEDAEWNEEYQVDTSRYEKYLQEYYDYTVFPVALDFLKKFGGIQTIVPERGRIGFRANPIEAADMLPMEEFKDLEELLGRSLCPVAIIDNGTIQILMDEKGMFFAIDECVLYYVSDNPIDMIRMVCSPRIIGFSILFNLNHL